MFKKITRRKLDAFLNKHASSKRVLDIGSGGSGYQKFFPNRLTVDIDPERKPEILADAHNLPFKDGEFEMVLCTEVLEHVKDPRKVIADIGRVLTPGGTVILTTRFVFPIHDAPNDYWRFTKYGLRELFGDFTIDELIPEAQSLTTLAVLLQRISFQTKLRFHPLTRFTFLVKAWLLSHMNWLISEEFGSVRKTNTEDTIMSSGYYVVARKK